MKAVVRNLSTIMRMICGIGSPSALQGLRALLQLAWTHFGRPISALEHLVGRAIGDGNAAGWPCDPLLRAVRTAWRRLSVVV